MTHPTQTVRGADPAGIWKFGSEKQLRQLVRGMDAKFQAAMREELQRMAKDRGLTLVLKRPEPVPAPAPVVRRQPKPRDVIAIAPTQPPAESPPTPSQAIMREVCAKYGISKIELVSAQRATPFVAARHEAMYRMSRETTLSLPAIAQKLGRGCHTTVINGIRRYEAALRGETYHKKRYGKQALEAMGQ